VRIRETASGRDVNVLEVTTLRNAQLALSPDGRTFAIQVLGRLTILSLTAAVEPSNREDLEIPVRVVDFDLRLKPDYVGFMPDGLALNISGWSYSKPQSSAGEPPDRYQVVSLPASRVGASSPTSPLEPR
jgi:hypothetical protein